jgi:AhpD family alkylhydroperoxidase
LSDLNRRLEGFSATPLIARFCENLPRDDKLVSEIAQKIDRTALVPETERRSWSSNGAGKRNSAKEDTMYDMKNLTKLKKLGELAPEAFKGFVAFDEAVFKEGAIPLKYKELMAVAVALTTQCPYCIEIHSKKAKKAGATEQELAETTLIAAALRAGGAVTHGTHTLE